MKVLVQDRRSRKFFGGEGRWLADHNKAMNFEGVLRAVEAVWEFGLSQARILLRKPDGRISVLMEVGSPL
jgi:hypothetical protein